MEAGDFGTQQQLEIPPTILHVPTPLMSNTAHIPPHRDSVQDGSFAQTSWFFASSGKLPSLPADTAAARRRAISTGTTMETRVFLEHAMRLTNCWNSGWPFL